MIAALTAVNVVMGTWSAKVALSVVARSFQGRSVHLIIKKG